MIDVCEDFLCINPLICATKGSLVLLIDFSFFIILNLNKLIKYFIEVSITRSQTRPRQPLARTVSSKANPSWWNTTSSSELPQQPTLEGGVSCSDRAFGARIKKMAQFQPRLTALLDEIQKVNDYLNVIVDSEDFSINEKLFLAILYVHKLSQLEKDLIDIERQLDE